LALPLLLSLAVYFANAYLRDYVNEALLYAFDSVGIEDVEFELSKLGISDAQIDSLQVSEENWVLSVGKINAYYHLKGLQNKEIDILEITGASFKVNSGHFNIGKSFGVNKTHGSTAWLPRLLEIKQSELSITFNGTERTFATEAQIKLHDPMSGWIDLSNGSGSHVLISMSDANDVIVKGEFPDNENWIEPQDASEESDENALSSLSTRNLSFAIRSYPGNFALPRSWAGEAESGVLNMEYDKWMIYAEENKILASGSGNELNDIFLYAKKVVLDNDIRLDELTANYKDEQISGKISLIDVSGKFPTIKGKQLSYSITLAQTRQLNIHTESLTVSGLALSDVRTELKLPNDNEIFCRAEAKVGENLALLVSADALLDWTDLSKGLISGGFEIPLQDIDEGSFPEGLGALSETLISGSVQGGGSFTKSKQGLALKGDIMFVDSLILNEEYDISIVGLNGSIEIDSAEKLKIKTVGPLLFSSFSCRGWMLTDGMLDMAWHKAGVSTFELSGTYGGGEVNAKASLSEDGEWTIVFNCKAISVSALSERINDFKGELKGGQFSGTVGMQYSNGKWQTSGGKLSLSAGASCRLRYPADGWLSGGRPLESPTVIIEQALTNFDLQSLEVQLYPKATEGPKIILILSGKSVDPLTFMGVNVGQVPIAELKVRVVGPLEESIKLLLNDKVSSEGISISD